MPMPRLLAFDLDGTLLRSDKTLSPANAAALADMTACGCRVALVSGRIGSSMRTAAASLAVDAALITLNGAAIYPGRSDTMAPVHTEPLPAEYADYLIDYAEGREFSLNYYCDGRLFAVRTAATAPWIDLYTRETGSAFTYVDSLRDFKGRPPLKAIFVGDRRMLDIEEERFRARWNGKVYLVRSWDHYLEFLHAEVNKGSALARLAALFSIGMDQVAAFGDAANDIPMLQAAGLGIAMRNADNATKAAAKQVSPWTNDEDGVAREWKRLKAL
jgi:Cof subfamily protein (haloacid dehalogenase superfamily)